MYFHNGPNDEKCGTGFTRVFCYCFPVVNCRTSVLVLTRTIHQCAIVYILHVFLYLGSGPTLLTFTVIYLFIRLFSVYVCALLSFERTLL